MVHSDTIELLRESNAGVKMGASAIGEVLDSVNDDGFRHRLNECMEAHQALGSELRAMLNDYHDSGKEPNAMAKGMSWFRANVILPMSGGDSAVASFITDGCNMGVKSLGRYLNEYEAADEKSKDIAKRLISLEEKLAEDIREYL